MMRALRVLSSRATDVLHGRCWSAARSFPLSFSYHHHNHVTTCWSEFTNIFRVQDSMGRARH